MHRITLAEMIETIVMSFLYGRKGGGRFGTARRSHPQSYLVSLFDGRTATVTNTARGWAVTWNERTVDADSLLEAAVKALGDGNTSFPLEQFR